MLGLGRARRRAGRARRATACTGWCSRAPASRFPYGTVVVNVSGSFALGLLVGLVTYQGLDADVRTVVGTGFIGAYTTFSSFSYDTFGLFEAGAHVAPRS